MFNSESLGVAVVIFVTKMHEFGVQKLKLHRKNASIKIFKNLLKGEDLYTHKTWLINYSCIVCLFCEPLKIIKTTKIENVIPFLLSTKKNVSTGIALLLPYCSYLDIVEYMPSTRLTSRCHYYDSEVRIHIIYIFIYTILEKNKY